MSVKSTAVRRPVFLNLLEIRLPIPAVMSIIHRATGVAMVLAIPLLVWLFELSLRSPAGFAAAAQLFSHWPMRLLLLVALWGVSHHFLAGIRYLLIDLDMGVERAAARRSAWLVTLSAPVAALLLWGGLL